MSETRQHFFIIIAISWVLGISALASPDGIDEPVTIEKISAFISRHPETRSVEQVLAVLPQSFRSHFTLVHDSRSAQGASFANPRVILYGDDASFVMTFNGDQQQRGFHSLEMVQWRDREKEFEFYKVDFDKTGKSSPVLSEKNPQSCKNCHGSPPRPNWETYSVWPGVYAGEDDRLTDKEKRELQNFISNQGTHSRYKYLHNVAQMYEPDRNAILSDRAIGQPNIRLTAFLYHRNAQRIAKQIMASPHYSQLRYAIAAAIVGCGNKTGGWIADFLPTENKEQIKIRNEDWTWLRKVLENRGMQEPQIQEVMRSYGNEERLFSVDKIGYPGYFENNPSIALLYLNRKLDLGIPVEEKNWTMAFNVGDVWPRNGFGMGPDRLYQGILQNNFREVFFSGLADMDPVLRDIPREPSRYYENYKLQFAAENFKDPETGKQTTLCEYLRSKSQSNSPRRTGESAIRRGELSAAATHQE